MTKKIMPNKCDLCTIGIGTSMLYFENTWRPYKHINQKVFHFNWEEGRLRVCEDCYERLKKMEDPDTYIRKLLKSLKQRKDK